MNVKDLIGVVEDNVQIYREVHYGDDGFGYKNLFVGRLWDAPDRFMECEIRVLGADKKNFVGIEIN